MRLLRIKPVKLNLNGIAFNIANINAWKKNDISETHVEATKAYVRACRKVCKIETAKIMHELDKLVLSEHELGDLLNSEFGITDYEAVANSTDVEMKYMIKCLGSENNMHNDEIHFAAVLKAQRKLMDRRRQKATPNSTSPTDVVLTILDDGTAKEDDDPRPTPSQVAAAVAKRGRLLHPTQAIRLGAFLKDVLLKNVCRYRGATPIELRKNKPGLLVLNLVVRCQHWGILCSADRLPHEGLRWARERKANRFRHDTWIKYLEPLCQWDALIIMSESIRRECYGPVGASGKLQHCLENDVSTVPPSAWKFVPKSDRKPHVKYNSNVFNSTYGVSRDIKFKFKGKNCAGAEAVAEMEIDDVTSCQANQGQIIYIMGFIELIYII